MRKLGLFALFWLAACGGGGGGGSGSSAPPAPAAPQFSVGSNTVNFVAATPNAATPTPQSVTASVTGSITGTLYIIVEVAGQAVASVSNVAIISDTSGLASVTPVSPKRLGTGSFTSTLTVKACVNSPTCASGQLAGSPQMINVNYTIGSAVQQSIVAPRLVTANKTGSVILRGAGFGNVTSVAFGTTPASSFTVRSATEIAANYPALAAGSYTVTLNGGAVVFGRPLLVRDPVSYPDSDLAYPDVPEEIGGLLFDDEHQALLVVTRYATAANNKLLRYAFVNGSWQLPQSRPIGSLRDMGLLYDGQTLLAMSSNHITEVDVTTLAPLYSTVNVANSGLGLTGQMRNLVIANDGNAIIASDASMYQFAPNSRAFTNMGYVIATGGTLINVGTSSTTLVGASADGARVIAQGLPLMVYAPGTGLLSNTPIVTINVDTYAPSVSGNGARLIMATTTAANFAATIVLAHVYASDFSVYCSLPTDTRAYVLSFDGERAYTLNEQSQLLAFDLSINPNGGSCAQTGQSVAIPDPGINPFGNSNRPSRVRMAIARDGGTLFLAGALGIVVRPVP